MPIRTPETIRRALGDEAVVDFASWVEQIVAEKAVPRDEYRQVLSRLDVLEHDVAEVKADLRALNARLDQMIQHLETMFDRQNRHIETRFDVMNQRFDAMNERLDQMNERILAQTRWMVGTIALFGTLITVLLAISRFAP